MPKKRQDKVLLIKPGSASNASSSSPGPRRDEAPQRVNDLIRESRRLQIARQASAATPVTSSVPPQVRSMLNIPMPQTPAPRAGTRSSGFIRQRRIPGPPPPRSWLIDSQHAPSDRNDRSNLEGMRLYANTAILPGVTFPTEGSLLHTVLRAIAANWEWHAEFDGLYLGQLPTKLKEMLIGFTDAYGDDVRSNPLRLLFLGDDDIETRHEVTRLDLTGAGGTWTTLRALTKDLVSRAPQQADTVATDNVPASWDDEVEPGIPPQMSTSLCFPNLRHLSLALSPGKTASWQDLITLSSSLTTLTSLSLAYWPQPTYTPNAATTRATVKQSPGMPSVVYGGTDMYTAHDNNWREAAGILRTLSRNLYCLTWLDLTGCGSWFDALKWVDDGFSSLGPEWNGSWRDIDFVCLNTGWSPLPPDIPPELADMDERTVADYDSSIPRKKYYHSKEIARHQAISDSAKEVEYHLRRLRNKAGGKRIQITRTTSMATDKISS
jgi:hypothetical protein